MVELSKDSSLDDVATALQDALDSARTAKTAAARTEAYNALQAAIWTLQRGGAPA